MRYESSRGYRIDCTRVFCRGRIELTEVSGTGMDVVPNLPKCRVRVWMSYRTYQSFGYGYGCRTELTKVSGTGVDVVPNLPKGREGVRMFYQAY